MQKKNVLEWGKIAKDVERKKVMLLNVVDVSHEHTIRYTNLYDIKEGKNAFGCVCHEK